MFPDETTFPTGDDLDAFIASIIADAPDIDPEEAAFLLAHCRVCGRPLDAQRSTRKTCSDRCRQRLSRARRYGSSLTGDHGGLASTTSALPSGS